MEMSGERMEICYPGVVTGRSNTKQKGKKSIEIMETCQKRMGMHLWKNVLS